MQMAQSEFMPTQNLKHLSASTVYLVMPDRLEMDGGSACGFPDGMARAGQALAHN